jgi:hypothetical protein
MSWEGRDRQILILAWRNVFVTAWAIGVLFEMKEPRVYRLMARLRDAGLVGYRRLYREYAGAYFLTRKGCRAAGLKSMREPSLELVSYRHGLGVLGILVGYERRGIQTLTEREIRARSADGETWSVPLVGRHGKTRWPDLVAANGNRLAAIELELAAKRSHRLASIIDGYERSSLYAEVRFVVEQGAVAERIARIAAGWRPKPTPNTVPSRKVLIEPWAGSNEIERIEQADFLRKEKESQTSLFPDPISIIPNPNRTQGETR